MLDKKDIEQAKKLFNEWDNKRMWKVPSHQFVEHSRKKAKDSFELGSYLLEKLEKTKELENNSAVTLWIVSVSYYSMFFEAEYLLSLDKKQLPEGCKDTHKTVYLAFLYYYIIKGSELEKGNFEIKTSRMSKALAMFKESQDETLELQRVQKSAKDLKKQREDRHAFTYRMTRSAEISEARNAINRAREFRNLVEEYVLSRK